MTAGEYEDVLFELPFIFCQANLPDQIIQSARYLLDWYLSIGLHRYKIADVRKMEDILKKLEDSLALLKDYSTSKLNLPKLHFLSHYAVSMLLFETPLILQTQAGEHNHKDFVKSPWRKSNKREPDEFMLKFVQRDTAFRMLWELDKIRAKRTLEESEIIGEPYLHLSFSEFTQRMLQKLGLSETFTQLLQTTPDFETFEFRCHHSVRSPRDRIVASF